MTQISTPSWNLLKQVVEKANQQLLICSPWLAKSGLLELREYLNSIGQLTTLRKICFWTRLADANTDSEFLLELILELQAKGVQASLRDSPSLHAKIYLADENLALVTSANLSESGFERNLEIATLTEDPALLKQILTVVRSIEISMQEVSLDQLQYFVREQRPLILQKEEQTVNPEPGVTPVWREQAQDVLQEPTIARNGEAVVVSHTTDEPSQAVVLKYKSYSIDEIFRKAWAQLSDSYERISALNIADYEGKKVRVTLFPANEAEVFYLAARNGGDSLFTKLEGTFVGVGRSLWVAESFDTSTINTGEKRETWMFRKKRARKTLNIATFPVVPSLTPVFYLVDIEEI